MFHQTIEQSNFFFPVTIAETIRWLRSSQCQWFALMLYSHYVGVRMSSFFAVIRIHVIHNYIHTKSYLCTLTSTTQSGFPQGAWFSRQNDKNKGRRITIYYIGNRTCPISVFAWLIVLLKNQKIPLLLPHTVNYSILPLRYIWSIYYQNRYSV